MHHLTSRFRSFADYQAALKSRYRNQVTRSRKKFQNLGLQVLHTRDPADISRLYTDEVHALYHNVWQRSHYRQEHMPARLFRDLAAALPGQSSLTLISHGRKPLAFTFGLSSGHTYHSFYSGLDYDANESADLYFNLFYEDLDHAFRRNHQDIQLGHTADDFMSRLGSTQRPLYVFVRAVSPIMQVAMKASSKFLFPSIPPAKTHDVFHQHPPRKNRPIRA